MSRYHRAYRWLLRLYPGRFRAEYEQEMVHLLTEQLADARARGDSETRVVLAAVVDVIRTAPREHIEKEVPVAHPASGSAEVAMVDPTARRNALLVVSLPIWLTAILFLVAPGYMDPVDGRRLAQAQRRGGRELRTLPARPLRERGVTTGR